jgi:manganese oxidase
VMSLGVTAGFAVAYPINVWMVAINLKHGLLTERRAATITEDSTGRPDAVPRETATHTPGMHHAGGV